MSDLSQGEAAAPRISGTRRQVLRILEAMPTNPALAAQLAKPLALAESLAREIVLLNPENGISILTQLRDAYAGDLDEFGCYQTAEALSASVYPKFKFSEFGRIYLEDEEFLEFYSRYMDAGNWHSLDRKYLLREMLKVVSRIPGDIAECGTYKGFSAYLMCRSLQGTSNEVHLFDSFEGLPDVEEVDGTWWAKGRFASPEDCVHETLAGFTNYKVYKGWIPDRFPEVAGRRFRLVHIDVDLYRPTYDSLEFFYPRVEPGGIILLDDHGCNTCPGAKQAADEFFSEREEKVAVLPTGQGLVLKA